MPTAAPPAPAQPQQVIADQTETLDAGQMPDGFAAVLDQIVPVEDPNQEPTDPSEAERKQSEEDAPLIRKFEEEAKPGATIQALLDELPEMRAWVHTDVMEKDTPTAVAANLVLRNQYVRSGQVQSSNPDWSVQPRRMRPPKDPGPPPQFPRPQAPPPPPPGTQLTPAIAAAHDQLMMQSQAWKDWDDAGGQEFIEWAQRYKLLLDYGDTNELLVKALSDQAELGPCMEGVVQDIQTDGFVWVKCVWVENLANDALTQHRPQDFVDTLARLTTLVTDFENDEFTEDDPSFKAMKDLADTVRDQIASEGWSGAGDQRMEEWTNGVPTVNQIDEIPRARQFVCESVSAEDISWQWSITRPEQWRKSRAITQRYRMTWDEIQDRFGLSREDLDQMQSGAGGADNRAPGASPDSVAAKQDDGQQENRAGSAFGDTPQTVYERFDRIKCRRYVWVSGIKRFLKNEVYDTTSRFFFPYFLFYWNRVTGRFIPVSDAKLQRPFVDEYNLMRSHDQAARRASYNKYIVGKNMLDAEEKAALENAVPEAVIELNKAREVMKHFQTVIGSHYDPMKYDTTRCRRDLDEMNNTPASARGDTGSTKFATSDQIANQTMNEQADRYRGHLERGLGDIGTHMLDIANAVIPEAHVKMLVGDGAVWPEVDRQTLWQALEVEVIAGSMGKPDQARQLALWKTIGEFLTSVGVGPGGRWIGDAPKLLGKIFEKLNIRDDPHQYLVEVPPPMAMPPPGGAPPGAGGPPHGPNASKPPGPPPTGPGAPGQHAPPSLIPGGSPASAH